MTQRIFDIENEKDMADLWDIVPDNIVRIKKDSTEDGNPYNKYYAKDYCYGGFPFIKINWHDKTEITKPVDYESMIGCVGWFSDNIDNKKAYIGILKEISGDGFKFKGELYDWWYSYFTPAKKSELKFWENKNE